MDRVGRRHVGPCMWTLFTTRQQPASSFGGVAEEQPSACLAPPCSSVWPTSCFRGHQHVGEDDVRPVGLAGCRREGPFRAARFHSEGGPRQLGSWPQWDSASDGQWVWPPAGTSAHSRLCPLAARAARCGRRRPPGCSRRTSAGRVPPPRRRPPRTRTAPASGPANRAAARGAARARRCRTPSRLRRSGGDGRGEADGQAAGRQIRSAHPDTMHCHILNEQY